MSQNYWIILFLLKVFQNLMVFVEKDLDYILGKFFKIINMK